MDSDEPREMGGSSLFFISLPCGFRGPHVWVQSNMMAAVDFHTMSDEAAFSPSRIFFFITRELSFSHSQSQFPQHCLLSVVLSFPI
jgi:hypothetical protein